MVANAAEIYELEIDASEFDRTVARSFDHLDSRAQQAAAKFEAAMEKQVRAAGVVPLSVDKVSAAFERLQGRMDPVIAVQQRMEREMIGSLATINNAVRLGVTTEAEATQMIVRLKQQQVEAINRVREAQLQQLVTSRLQRPANDNLGGINAGYQLQDVLVQASMGGVNPAMIGLMQGSQMAMSFQGQTAVEAAKTLGTALASLANPIMLVSVGLTTALAAAVQYFMAGRDGAKALDEVFKQHEATLARIDERYEGFSARLTKHVETAAALAASARSDLAKAEAAAAQQAEEFRDFLIPMREYDPRTDRVLAHVRDEFKPFEQAILDLDRAITNGQPNFAAFEQSIENIVATDPENLRLTGDAILKAGENAVKAQAGADAARQAVDNLGAAAAGRLGDIQALSRALETLAGIALPALSNADRVAEQVGKGIAAAATMEQDLAVFLEAEAAMKRIADVQEVAELLANGGVPVDRPNDIERLDREAAFRERASRRAKTEYEREREALKALTEQLEFELSLIGMTDEARRAAEASRRAGAAATEDERQKIVQLNEALFQAREAQRQVNEQTEFFRDLAYNAFMDAIPAIETGNKALDRFLNTLIQVVAQAVLLGEGPLASLFGTSGGGGLLGSLLGGAGSLLGGGSSLAGDPVLDPWGSANGNVFANDNIVPFRLGGAFTNSIVDRPTFFPFARGIGVMGEAGPEAIMPLQRDSFGRLGVSATPAANQGGGSAGRLGIDVAVYTRDDGKLAAIARQAGADAGAQQADVRIQTYDDRLPDRVDEINRYPHRRSA